MLVWLLLSYSVGRVGVLLCSKGDYETPTVPCEKNVGRVRLGQGPRGVAEPP